MPLYTFYPTRRDGSSPSFEAHELVCDTTALERAVRILTRHESCDTIEVWDGDRQVGVHEAQALVRTA